MSRALRKSHAPSTWNPNKYQQQVCEHLETYYTVSQSEANPNRPYKRCAKCKAFLQWADGIPASQLSTSPVKKKRNTPDDYSPDDYSPPRLSITEGDTKQVKPDTDAIVQKAYEVKMKLHNTLKAVEELLLLVAPDS